MKRVLEFLKHVKPNDEICIIYHNDSVARHTELLASVDGKLKKIVIENLYEHMKKRYGEIIRNDGKKIVVPKNLMVFSIVNGKTKLSKVLSLIKHRTKKRMFEIKSKIGELKVTEDHSLMTLKNGKFVPEIPINIKYIASPLKYEFGDTNLVIDLLDYPETFNNLILEGDFDETFYKKIRYKSNLPLWYLKHGVPIRYVEKIEKLKPFVRCCRIRGKRFLPQIVIDETFLTFFGLWVADGCKGKGRKCEYIHISAWDDVECRKIIKRVAKIFGCKISMLDEGITAQFTSSALFRLMNILEFKGNASTKRVPPWIFGVKERLMSAFLRGYLSGDGTVSKGDINVSSLSRKLLDDIQTLLLFFGIRSYIRKDGNGWKLSINHDEYKKIFLKKIGFLQKEKNAKVKIAKCIRSVDIIPLEIEIKEKIRKRFNKNINFSREFLNKIVSFQDKKMKKIFENILSLDVFWEKARIRDLSIKNEIVYDIETESGNFVAENVVVKNTDGIASCVLLIKLLEKLYNIKPFTLSQPMPTDKNLLRRIQTTAVNKIIFLDLPIDQQPNVLKKLRGFADILIIDHHPMSRDMNSQNIVHYNPRFNNPKIYQSVSYLTYKICSTFYDQNENLWIAIIGIIGDYDTSYSKDLIVEAEKKYDLSLFNKIVAMIESAKATRAMTCEQIVEIILNIKEPEQMLSGDFLQSYQEIQNELAGLMIDAESRLERHGNLFLYELKSKYNLRSPVATKLSEKYPDKFIVVFEKIKNKINAAARNQNRKYNVDRVLKRAASGLKASAGGHEAAGGATLSEKDWEKFRDNLIELIG